MKDAVEKEIDREELGLVGAQGSRGGAPEIVLKYAPLKRSEMASETHVLGFLNSSLSPKIVPLG